MRDSSKNHKPVITVAPAVRAGSVTGDTVDRLGFMALQFLVTTGAWTNGTHTVVVEESDDGTTFAAAPAANLVGDFPVVDAAGKGGKGTIVGYVGDARYVRAKVNVAGSPATGAVVGVTALLSRARSKPAA